MDDFWPTLLSGTLIGTVVTAVLTTIKPLIDHWVRTAEKRQDKVEERRKVVEGVVGLLRGLRIEHQKEVRGEGRLSYDHVLEASDAALLIHDQGFARYLSRDIENVSGYRVLHDWYLEVEPDYDAEPARAAREARWNHLKRLVERASSFAVTGKWEKEWATEADRLAEEMDKAAAYIFADNR